MKINHFFLTAIFVAMALTLSACGPDPCTGFACFIQSSSSVVVSSCSTAANNTSTQYCSYGIMKEYGFVTHGEQIYKTVEIGTQTWMAENLNYDVPGSVCYDNDPANCEKYGRLYDWAAAMDLPASYNTTRYDGSEKKHKGICPEGWHIPSYSSYDDGDWNKLGKIIGGWNTDGVKHLKAIEWDGEDTYGFAALPGGGSDGEMAGQLLKIRTFGGWWSTHNGPSFAYYVSIGGKISHTNTKSSLNSVRCLKD